MTPDRRHFLRLGLGATAWGALGPWSTLAAATQASAPSKGAFPDYKALVCVFLHGGNDSFNMVVPIDVAGHAVYQATRPAMAIPRADAAALALSPLAQQPGVPGGPPSDGGSYGLHPAMPELRQLFNQGQAAILCNVGPLLGPITRDEYLNNLRPYPPQLFSHSDQANFWQTSRPDDANADGWGGRMADLLPNANPHQQLPMTLSLAGQSLFQRGRIVDQYVMSAYGVDAIDYLGAYQNELGTQTFHALMAEGTHAHLFQRGYARATRRSIATYQRIASALGTPPTWTTPFPTSHLGAQLRQVAELIHARGPQGLDMRRQIFYVSLGGFDTHDDQLPTQASLLGQLSQALHAFQRATEQMGVSSSVTSFTASDFGRTLSTNGDGTDHGWGGHHLIMGGAVRGARYYGRMPSLAQHNNPDDAGYGQIIPTTGVDPYAATLARWFGVSAPLLPELFPNLHLYPQQDVGFMG